jgi:hypothetical protein
MAVLALVFMVAFVIVGLGVRGWQHGRRYGYNVLSGLKRKPGTKEWYIGKCTGTGAFAIAAAACRCRKSIAAVFPAVRAGGSVGTVCRR